MAGIAVGFDVLIRPDEKGQLIRRRCSQSRSNAEADGQECGDHRPAEPAVSCFGSHDRDNCSTMAAGEHARVRKHRRAFAPSGHDGRRRPQLGQGREPGDEIGRVGNGLDTAFEPIDEFGLVEFPGGQREHGMEVRSTTGAHQFHKVELVPETIEHLSPAAGATQVIKLDGGQLQGLAQRQAIGIEHADLSVWLEKSDNSISESASTRRLQRAMPASGPRRWRGTVHGRASPPRRSALGVSEHDQLVETAQLIELNREKERSRIQDGTFGLHEVTSRDQIGRDGDKLRSPCRAIGEKEPDRAYAKQHAPYRLPRAAGRMPQGPGRRPPTRPGHFAALMADSVRSRRTRPIMDCASVIGPPAARQQRLQACETDDSSG